MVRKYVRVIENREINSMTDKVWSIHDVPNTWKSRVQAQVIADGYTFDEDGTVINGNVLNGMSGEVI